MSGVSYGIDYNYAHSRLNGSYVLWGDKLVQVIKVLNSGEAFVKDIFHNHHEVSSDKLNIQPTKLGYCNYKNGCYFTYRKPQRFYKQGLTTTTFSHPNKIGMLSKSLQDTMIGKYKSPEECAEIVLCGEKKKLGFSRDFAFSKDYKNKDQLLLNFREIPVGYCTISPQGSQINYHLNDNFEFLHEMLEKSYNVQ